MAAEAKQLDDTIEIVTPENIAFEYRVAGPFRRMLAYLVDVILRIVVFFAVMMALYIAMAWIAYMVGAAAATIFSFTNGFLAVLYFFSSWLYGGLFETFMNGQTPGKRLLGIRVLTVEGQPVNGMQAIVRNILRTIDVLPLLPIQAIPGMDELLGDEVPINYILPSYMVGLIFTAASPRFQRLGDLVCGTMVVVEERQWLTGVIKLDDPRAAQLAEYIPVNFTVNRSMARAISAYVDRRRFFSPARRREVARHLADPLLRLFQLPPDTSHDLLLCALYYRTFVAVRPEERSFKPMALAAPIAGAPSKAFG
jgi:uncharacterized RDD family membrane protein YckC